jgi:hypothetical protein
MDKSQAHDSARALAHSLDCITDEDLQSLAGVKASTTEAWRKRGIGPAYILFGKHYLYPRAAVSKHLQALVRERAQTPAKALL